jgi:hypothetical protein
MATKRPSSKKSTEVKTESVSGAVESNATTAEGSAATAVKRARKTPPKKSKAASPSVIESESSVSGAMKSDAVPAVESKMPEVSEGSVLVAAASDPVPESLVSPAVTANLEAAGPAEPKVATKIAKISTYAVDIQEAIRQRAYELFAQRGFENGHDFDDWLKAEEEVLARFGV